jgi:hypothetical protein
MTKKSKQPLERDDTYYTDLPVGTRFWNPCCGIESMGIERGHVGRVDLYIGNKKFERGGWITKDQAQIEKINLADTDTLCENCKRIIGEITNNKGI